MKDIIIGKGSLDGKGIYAGRDFKKGEVVIQYKLKALTDEEFRDLLKNERLFVHTHWGTKFLYSEPERYVNHSPNPNTLQDLTKKCDIAICDIKKGEMITTDARKDDIK
jgi:hypothetical protein